LPNTLQEGMRQGKVWVQCKNLLNDLLLHL